MTDAISRSAVLDVGNVRKVVEYDEAGYDMTYDAVPVEVIEALSALDVASVVHARWTEDGTCSACGSEAAYSEYIRKQYDYDWDENLIETGEEVYKEHDLTSYCPNCGARMDGEANE